MSNGHWTNRSPEDFLYSIASDFVEQLRAKMKTLEMTQSKLARAAKVSKSYVSQVFNDPGNLTLVTIVKFARVVGMKVSVVGYEDDPAHAGGGPINSEMFRLCWEEQGRPADLWAVKRKSVAKPNTISMDQLLANLDWGRNVYGQTNTGSLPNATNKVKKIPSSATMAKENTLIEWDATQRIDWR